MKRQTLTNQVPGTFAFAYCFFRPEVILSYTLPQWESQGQIIELINFVPMKNSYNQRINASLRKALEFQKNKYIIKIHLVFKKVTLYMLYVDGFIWEEWVIDKLNNSYD